MGSDVPQNCLRPASVVPPGPKLQCPATLRSLQSVCYWFKGAPPTARAWVCGVRDGPLLSVGVILRKYSSQNTSSWAAQF